MAGSTPIIIRKPIFRVAVYGAADVLQPPVDLSDDVSSVELSPDISIDTVATFTGKFRVADEPEWSATLSIVVTEGTQANWEDLVGSKVQCQLFDRGPVQPGDQYRAWDSEILIDPSLGGATNVEERARAFDIDIPVLTTPVWMTEA
jgi:hypothetical protein